MHPVINSTYPWGESARFVDIAGGQGSLTGYLLQQHPHAIGLVTDQAQACPVLLVTYYYDYNHYDEIIVFIIHNLIIIINTTTVIISIMLSIMLFLVLISI